MKAIKEYPKKVQRNLTILEEAFNTSDSAIQPEIRLLVAALRSLGFGVTHAMAGYPKGSWSKSGAPWIDIESPLVPYTLGRYNDLPTDWWFPDTPGYRALRLQVRKATLEAKRELLKLLEDFYRNRHSLLSISLTFDLETGASSHFRLHCQGAKDAALLSEPEYSEWLRSAQAEMQAFAEFLCTKIVD